MVRVRVRVRVPSKLLRRVRVAVPSKPSCGMRGEVVRGRYGVFVYFEHKQPGVCTRWRRGVWMYL